VKLPEGVSVKLAPDTGVVPFFTVIVIVDTPPDLKVAALAEIVA
jgi:hypothetical protein